MRLLDPALIPSRLIEPAQKKPLTIAEVTPPSRFWFFNTIGSLLKWLFVVLWLRIPRKLSHADYAHRLREFLEAMGGLWIKAGQLLSLRRDLFSQEVCDELSKLLDQMTGFSPEVARNIVETELGGKIEDFFDKFEILPFAAASIGQLHLARLREEQIWVAVKIQRPHIAVNMRRQLFVIGVLLRLIERTGVIPQLHATEVLSELGYLMEEEVDYRIEASNIRRMRKSLRKHKIYVPKVFLRRSSRRVLVMEYIQGLLMSDFIKVLNDDPTRVDRWLQENNVDPHVVAQRLHDSLMRQIIEDNLFHGDLHPGNIVLLRDSNLTFIDFGSVGFMDTEYLRKYAMFLRCIAEREHSKAVDIFFVLSPALPNIDIEEVKDLLIRCFRAWETRTLTASLPYHEKSLSTLQQDVIRILHQYRIPATWLFLKLNRANVTLDASLMHLYPNMNYPRMIRRYFRQAYYRELDRTMNRQTAVSRTIAFASAFSKLPELVDEYQMFQAPVFRRHAHLYEGRVNKVSFVFMMIFHTGSRMVLLLGLILFAIFLQQHYPSVVRPISASAFGQIAEGFPQLPLYLWLMVLAVVLYVYRGLSLVRRRMSEKEKVD